MGFEVVGRVIKVLPEQSGEGRNGTWRKAGFVIDLIEEKYPKKACFTVWGDVIDQAKRYSEGANVKVHFEVESREYNDRWYTDLKAWRLEDAASGGAQPAASAPMSNNFDLPPLPTQAPVITVSAQADDDDLPF